MPFSDLPVQEPRAIRAILRCGTVVGDHLGDEIPDETVAVRHGPAAWQGPVKRRGQAGAKPGRVADRNPQGRTIIRRLG
ncbi:MAG TPA: hypothetical protein VM899_14400, partial [Rubellimicrobium sp.]|nr:hypothetical protein [Rubellimicrobium sp.]